MEVLQVVTQLGRALWSLKGMYDQDIDNKREIEELQSFIEDYDHQLPALKKHLSKGGGNVMGMGALKNLEKDVVQATKKLERWSMDKSFFRLFTSIERMEKLERLHFKILASVQKCLGFVSISMLIDLQATHTTLLESNAELKSLLITSIGNTHGMLPAEVREEVVFASSSSFGDSKFWEDVLAAVDSREGVGSIVDKTNKYEDPITTNLMIDPIVASDGNTYCRWTIIDNNVRRNPFNVREALTIVVDNLFVRRGLFKKFPEQSKLFRQRRDDYRRQALSLQGKGFLGDAALALRHVLEWNKDDIECVEALKEVEGILGDAREKYLEVSPSRAQEHGCVVPIGSSMNDSRVEPPIDIDEAYVLFLDLSSSTPKLKHDALRGVGEWISKDEEFRTYFVKNGGVQSILLLVCSRDLITQGHALSILLSMSSELKPFDDLRGGPADAVVPVALVLKEGSSEACEQAAQILWNFGDTLKLQSWRNCDEVLVDSVLTALPARSLRVQQILASLIRRLCAWHRPFRRRFLRGGLVLLLIRLMAEQTAMLEVALHLMRWLATFTAAEDSEWDCFTVNRVPAKQWLDVVVSKAPVHQERAASIVCILCNQIPAYREKAIEGRVIQRFAKLIQSTSLKRALSAIARVDFKTKSLKGIPFPEENWWAPT